jgi:hypothetical protein
MSTFKPEEEKGEGTHLSVHHWEVAHISSVYIHCPELCVTTIPNSKGAGEIFLLFVLSCFLHTSV